MPWIKVIEQKNAEGKLKAVYSGLAKQRGKISNLMMANGLNPSALKAHLELYLSIMFNNSGLKRDEKELIAVVVSVANNCDYCVKHHALALNHYWKDEKKIKKVIHDYKRLNLPVRASAILKYAVKLTESPELVSETDILNLRINGLADENILNINLIISYFNFVNRIAMGLGIESSEDEVKGYKY